MIRPPPISTLTVTPFPYTPPFRSRFLGVAGLEPVGALDAAEQRIAIGLGDRLAARGLPPRKIRFRIEVFVEFGKFMDRRLCQLGQITRGHIGDAFVGPAVRGDEMAVGHAELLRLGIRSEAQTSE